MSEQKKPVLNPQGFKGTVLTKEWLRYHTGRQYAGFFGTVYIYQDKELGLSVRGNESNWMVRIQGATESMNILGCQIRGIIEHTIQPSVEADIKEIP